MVGSINSLASSLLQRPISVDRPDATAAAGSVGNIGNLGNVGVNGIENLREVPGARAIQPTGQVQSFDNVFGKMVGEVNTKLQTADVEKARVMSGESNNLHQAMLSIQEANVAFSLMTEVRNKLVESYQEVMRMQV